MKLLYPFHLAFQGLWTNKSRSVLTILGIFIGIASIMLIMTVGDGAEGLIIDQVSGMGPEMIAIRPGQEPSGPTDFAETMYSDSLTTKDVEALKKKRNVPYLAEIAPAVIVPGSVSYKGETFKPVIFGWSAIMMANTFDLYPSEGVLFGEDEEKQKAAVAVIGTKVKEELFGESDAIGENIKIKNKNFRVIGVLEARGQLAFFNVDELVLLPYTSAQSYLLGIDHFHEIITRATSPDLVDQTIHDIELTLRESHGITDPSKDDFFVVSQQGLVNQIRIIVQVFTIFLTAVVAIALVVGGIGVMNIMLVSVTERTNEIGLRKAVGATTQDISRQFLIEAVLLTLVGGMLGVLLGAFLSFLISMGLTYFYDLYWPFTFPIFASVLAVGFSSVVGLIFGLYPARQASRKDPIEALRYE